MTVFVFSLVEVKPYWKRLTKGFPSEYSGAFVNCLVLAEHSAKANYILKSALAGDGYEVCSLGEKRVFSAAGQDQEIEKYAKDLTKDDPVWYGSFNCYP